MNQISEKCKKITPYTPIGGDCAIRLDANESYLAPPARALERFKARLSGEALNRYPDPFAAELVRKYADFYFLDPQTVVAGNGSDELIGVILSAFLDKGDKMVTLTPDFSMYAFYAGLIGAQIRDIAKDGTLAADLDAAAALCRAERPKLVILSNPCNPTGQGIPRAQIEPFLRQCGCTVVLDEAYMDFWREEESLLRHIREFDNLIVLRTMSKALGCAGLRLGFAVSQKPVADTLKAVKSPYNVNRLSQMLGCEILSEPEELRRGLALLREGKQELERALDVPGRGYRVIPTVTNFVLTEFESDRAAQTVFSKLLDAGIAVRQIHGRYLRITSGSRAENEAFLSEFFKIQREETP